MAKCPYNGLKPCDGDCMAFDDYNSTCKRVDLSDSVLEVAKAVCAMDKTLFDTLGSAESGYALRGLSGLSGAVNDISCAIDSLSSAVSEIER